MGGHRKLEQRYVHFGLGDRSSLWKGLSHVGIRVVIPKTLQAQMLNELHRDHPESAV